MVLSVFLHLRAAGTWEKESMTILLTGEMTEHKIMLLRLLLQATTETHSSLIQHAQDLVPAKQKVLSENQSEVRIFIS